MAPSPLSPEQARYLQLATETATLNRLVLELQSTLLKTDPNTLPLALIKKADDIQKLATTLKKQLRPNP